MTYNRADMNLVRHTDAVRVSVAETSANFFSMFGSAPAIGRGFLAEEDQFGSDTVAVISHALWQQAFGADPGVLGSTVRLNGHPVTILGVAQPAFDFPGRTSVWTPTTFDFQRLPKTRVVYWERVGRIKPGLTRADANAMFVNEIDREEPGRSRRTDRPRVGLIPLRERLAGPVGEASLVLMAAVLFVLMIACANVAHLLLTRTSERRTELMIRATLGASRARLVQQLMTESLAMALVAAAAGLVVAQWVARLAPVAQPGALAHQAYTVLDWHVLAFATGMAALTSVVFGVVPASLASRLQPGETLARARTAVWRSGTARMRQLLIAAQVSLTLVLLVASIAMGRTFLNLLAADLGFQAGHVITMSVSLAGPPSDAKDLQRGYVAKALERLRALPGVTSAGAVNYLPLTSAMHIADAFGLESGGTTSIARVAVATPGYFRTMGTRIVDGREFTEADRAASELVCVMNETLARAIGDGVALVGRRIRPEHGRTTPLTVVGIARDVKDGGPGGGPAVPQLFLPWGQTGADYLTFVARVKGRADEFLATGRDAIRTTDRTVPVFDVSTLADRLAENVSRPRFYTSVVMFFGAFALLVSIVGVYGVASYSITQRSHEIGVRVAVGASTGGIRSMLLRDGLTPVVVGTIIGVGTAAATGRFLEHLVSNVQRVDVVTCVAAAVFLVLSAFAAVWSATARAVRSNPLDALRAE